jgi:hypothetical protein
MAAAYSLHSRANSPASLASPSQTPDGAHRAGRLHVALGDLSASRDVGVRHLEPALRFAQGSHADSVGAVPVTKTILNSGVSTSNMAQFIENAKKNPGKVSYGHGGIGSVFHLMG